VETARAERDECLITSPQNGHCTLAAPPFPCAEADRQVSAPPPSSTLRSWSRLLLFVGIFLRLHPGGFVIYALFLLP
jgi:hypothetical protein